MGYLAFLGSLAPTPTPAAPQPVTMVLHGFPGMRKKGVVGAEVLDSLWLLV